MWRADDARFGVCVMMPPKRNAHAGYLESRQYMRLFMLGFSDKWSIESLENLEGLTLKGMFEILLKPEVWVGTAPLRFTCALPF